MEELEKQFTDEMRGLIEKFIEESNKEFNEEAHIDSRNPIEMPSTYENSEYGELLQQLNETRGYTERKELIAKLKEMKQGNIKAIKKEITNTKRRFLKENKNQTKTKIDRLNKKINNIDNKMQELAKKVNNITKISGSIGGEKEVYKLAQSKKKEHIKGIKDLLKQKEKLQEQIKEIDANANEIRNKYLAIRIRSTEDAYKALTQLQGEQEKDTLQTIEQEKLENVVETTSTEGLKQRKIENLEDDIEEYQFLGNDPKLKYTEGDYIEEAAEEQSEEKPKAKAISKLSEFVAQLNEDGMVKEEKKSTEKTQNSEAYRLKANELGITYSAKEDKYLITDLKTGKVMRIAERESIDSIPEEDKNYLEKESGLNIDRIANIDRNILNILINYDYETGDRKAIEYLNMLTRTEKENKVKSNKIKIEYNLKTLYDKKSLEHDVRRKQDFSYEQINEILSIANQAKQRGVAKVTKGLKVRAYEIIDKVVGLLPKRKTIAEKSVIIEENLEEKIISQTEKAVNRDEQKSLKEQRQDFREGLSAAKEGTEMLYTEKDKEQKAVNSENIPEKSSKDDEGMEI